MTDTDRQRQIQTDSDRYRLPDILRDILRDRDKYRLTD